MALHMGDYLPGFLTTGDSAGWDTGTAEAQGSITNLTPHVSGGAPTGVSQTNSTTDASVLHYAAGIVIVSGLLLWFLGGVVFKSVRL